MSTLEVAERTAAASSIDSAAVDALRAGLRGEVILPGQAGYDEARTVWNAMIDRKPAAVVRCLGAADVIRSIGFARDQKLALAVKGGGHNIAGSAVCDGGLMIDLSPMRSVWVDATNGRARVEPGATLGDFDREAQAFGLATPLGINSTTGVAGLTLGGGFGWLSRKYGLSVDNLLSADMVTADGALVRASESRQPGSVLGLARRRRQLRRRHLVRVPPAQGRTRPVIGPDRLPLPTGERRARAIP